ncbi:MAG: phage tail protein [Alphaproteobacteria bacterium]
MAEYYTIITEAGLQKEAAGHQNGGSSVQLSEMAVGDGLGFMYDPDSNATALKNEVFRTSINRVYVDDKHPHQLVVEAVIPEDAGPFYIREVGIFDADGALFAIGKYPETNKPELESGSAKDLYIRMVLGFSTTPEVNLIIDPSVVLVTVNNINESVSNAVSEHETGLESHSGAFQGVLESERLGPVGIHNQYFNGSVTDYGLITGFGAFAAENVPMLRCDLARGGFNYDYEGISS